MKVWLSRTDTKVGIPYTGSERRADGSQNHCYIDLKRNSEKIHDIPELKEFHELKTFVQMMNSHDSLFRTVGCERAFSPSESSEFKTRLVSLVEIIFEVVEWNTNVANFEGLYRAFETFAGAKGDLPNCYGVEFSVGPAFFNDHGVSGWIATIWIYGYEQSDSDARKQWALALQIVHDFFNRDTEQTRKTSN